MNTIDGILYVSESGRGFVVAGERGRFVITAAHCLPCLPPSDLGLGSDSDDRTYVKLLGRLGGLCDVWAECLYADPVYDLAALGSPAHQAFGDQAEAYEALVKSVPLTITDLRLARERKPSGVTIRTSSGPITKRPREMLSLPKWEGTARLLSLDAMPADSP